MNIYVGNLAYGLSEEQLSEVFAEFGEVQSAKIIKDRESGRSKGFGFVEMASHEAGEKALKELEGRELEGRPLKVSEARPKENKPRR